MRSSWVGVGSNPVTGILARRENRDPDRHAGRTHRKMGRDWSHAAASQGTWGITEHQDPAEARKDSLRKPLGTHAPAHTLISNFWPVKALREYISVVTSYFVEICYNCPRELMGWILFELGLVFLTFCETNIIIVLVVGDLGFRENLMGVHHIDSPGRGRD